MGQFEKALELLGLMRLHQRAGLLFQACTEFEAIVQNDQKDILFLNLSLVLRYVLMRIFIVLKSSDCSLCAH